MLYNTMWVVKGMKNLHIQVSFETNFLLGLCQQGKWEIRKENEESARRMRNQEGKWGISKENEELAKKTRNQPEKYLSTAHFWIKGIFIFSKQCFDCFSCFWWDLSRVECLYLFFDASLCKKTEKI